MISFTERSRLFIRESTALWFLLEQLQVPVDGINEGDYSWECNMAKKLTSGATYSFASNGNRLSNMSFSNERTHKLPKCGELFNADGYNLDRVLRSQMCLYRSRTLRQVYRTWDLLLTTLTFLSVRTYTCTKRTHVKWVHVYRYFSQICWKHL